jgi:NTE family protein
MSNYPIRRLAIALQGGGSHGAFTWGVLDRLLQSRDSRSLASAERAPAR